MTFMIFGAWQTWQIVHPQGGYLGAPTETHMEKNTHGSLRNLSIKWRNFRLCDNQTEI